MGNEFIFDLYEVAIFSFGINLVIGLLLVQISFFEAKYKFSRDIGYSFILIGIAIVSILKPNWVDGAYLLLWYVSSMLVYYCSVYFFIKGVCIYSKVQLDRRFVVLVFFLCFINFWIYCFSSIEISMMLSSSVAVLIYLFAAFFVFDFSVLGGLLALLLVMKSSGILLSQLFPLYLSFKYQLMVGSSLTAMVGFLIIAYLYRSVKYYRSEEIALIESFFQDLPQAVLIYSSKGECLFNNKSSEVFLGDNLELTLADFIDDIGVAVDEGAGHFIYRASDGEYICNSKFSRLFWNGRYSSVLEISYYKLQDSYTKYDALTKLPNLNSFHDDYKCCFSRNKYLVSIKVEGLMDFARKNSAINTERKIISANACIVKNIGSKTEIYKAFFDEFYFFADDDDFSLAENIKGSYIKSELIGEVNSLGLNVAILPLDETFPVTSIPNIFNYHRNSSLIGSILVSSEAKKMAMISDYIERNFKRSLYGGDIVLYVQKKVDCNNETVGLEVLARWFSKEYGMISPAIFIPILERYGFVKELSIYIVSYLDGLLRSNSLSFKCSVNLSVYEVVDERFINYLRFVSTDNPDLTDFVFFEITESVFEGGYSNIIDNLNIIRSLGFKLSLDDFGTGYSSLQRLQKLPFDELKIDKAFVDNLCTDDGREMFGVLCSIANVFNMSIVVEGVETEEQFDFCKEYNVNEFQGYLFSRPIPFAELL